MRVLRLVVDYRGYAESFGVESPSESKVYEDALAAFKYLTRIIHRIRSLFYGHSLVAQWRSNWRRELRQKRQQA